MEIIPVGSNMTEMRLGDNKCCADHFDIRILFSYKTPVAYTVVTSKGRLYFRTKEFYSVTTSRHINKWLPKDQAEEVDQSVIDDVVNGNGH